MNKCIIPQLFQIIYIIAFTQPDLYVFNICRHSATSLIDRHFVKFNSFILYFSNKRDNQ